MLSSLECEWTSNLSNYLQKSKLKKGCLWTISRDLTILMHPNACAILKVRKDMAQPQQSVANAEPPRRQNDLPPEILEIIGPALQFGGLSGMDYPCFYLPNPCAFSRRLPKFSQLAYTLQTPCDNHSEIS